jgi:serine/threonine protein kinase
MSAPAQIAHYRITGKLGEGGMGVVYRATDTRLSREVAIKVLPPSMAADPDRLARFEREARLLAGLDHPNIGAIYGIEQSGGNSALVLALIEGPTLADRIAQGPIPHEEAVAIARQLAEALEYAHDRGIIHRDLKPANIKITPEGVVKVLDFGLARALADDSAAAPAASPTISPTLSMRATQAGMILGTAAYMAPEQAKGKTVDRRADIWAFGIILLEMLTGRPVFSGESVAEILAASIKDAPPLDRLPADTPPAVRGLIARCLEKDPRQRLQAIGEARILLAAPLHEPAPTTQAAAIPTRSSKLPWAVAATCLLALAALAFRHFREQPAAAPLVRFQVSAPPNYTLLPSLAVSPDGRRLAFRVSDGQNHIAVRAFDSLDSRILSGTDGGSSPFWSPDSRYIAFAVPGKLRMVEASSGPVQTIADLSAFAFTGGSWAPGGVILFGVPGKGLFRVSADGGTPALVAPGPFASPVFLPDGRHFIYLACPRECSVYLRSLDTKPEEILTPLTAASFSYLAYAATPDPNLGYVLFARETSLMALPLDLRTYRPAGAAVSISEGIGAQPRSISASPSGVIAFRADGSDAPSGRLVWFDRQGRETGQLGPPGRYSSLVLSPDGRFAFTDRLAPGGGYDHLLTVDVARAVFARLNPGDVVDYAGAAVSPDGRVAFAYEKQPGVGDIYLRAANGTGAPEPLVVSATNKHPNDWSADGRYLIYDDHTAQKQDLWVVPVAGDRKPIPFLVTPADETLGRFSPAGHWIAYISDESGTREVYVQGFLPDRVPCAGIGKWQISPAGGDKPRWSRDGKQIFYIAPDGKMMSVPINATATTFQPGVAVPLFQAPRLRGYDPYDVSPDGRFLFNALVDRSAASDAPITVVLNWWGMLKR